MRRTLALVSCAGLALLLAGCATSRINFEQPVNSKLMLMNWSAKKVKKEYTLPMTLDLCQRAKPWSDQHGRAIRMVLPDGTKLKGYLFVYRVEPDKLEKLVPVKFELTEKSIERIREGKTAEVEGFSSWGWPVFKAVLALDTEPAPPAK